jgi:hypothetical protein
MVVSAPPDAHRGARLLRAAVGVISRHYEDVEISGGEGGRFGGRPSRSRVLRARNRRGTRLRVLVAAAQGRRRAWLIEVFSAEPPRPRRLLETQAALSSLRLSG